MTTLKTTIHRDGTITYWSVYDQSWRRRVHPASIPDAELAAMPATERDRVIAHRPAACECGEITGVPCA